MFRLIVLMLFMAISMSMFAYVAHCERRERRSANRRREYIREHLEAMPEWARKEYIDNFAETVKRHIEEN